MLQERTGDLLLPRHGQGACVAGSCRSSSSRLVLLATTPHQLPLNLFVLLSLRVPNESMRRSLAQGCSSARACSERRLAQERENKKERKKDRWRQLSCAHKHLNALRRLARTNDCKSDGSRTSNRSSSGNISLDLLA